MFSQASCRNFGPHRLNYSFLADNHIKNKLPFFFFFTMCQIIDLEIWEVQHFQRDFSCLSGEMSHTLQRTYKTLHEDKYNFFVKHFCKGT